MLSFKKMHLINFFEAMNKKVRQSEDECLLTCFDIRTSTTI